MYCSIYKSVKTEGAYLYIQRKDDFSSVPEQLMTMFGKPTLVMVVDLEERNLARVDVEKVKIALKEQGFFLQLPPPIENQLEKYKKEKTLRSER